MSKHYYTNATTHTPENNARCLRCVYHGILSGSKDGIICCNYLLATGERRGCPPGVSCTRFHAGGNKGLSPDLAPEGQAEAFNPRVFPPGFEPVQKPKRGRPNTRIQVDPEAYQRLRDTVGLYRAAELAGIASSNIRPGRMTRGTADKILAATGIDLRGKYANQGGKP